MERRPFYLSQESHVDQVGYFNRHLHGDNIIKQDSAEPWLNHFPSQLQLAAKFLQSWISSSVRTIKPIFLSEFPGVLRISHAQNFWHVEAGPQYTLTSAVNVIIVRRTEQQHGKLRSKSQSRFWIWPWRFGQISQPPHALVFSKWQHSINNVLNS